MDGGILNNLPVDIAKDMGADIIIAVYPGCPAREDDPGAFADWRPRKTVGVVVAASEFKNMKAADVFISADLKGFTAMDYNRWQDLIPKGYEGAQIKASMLSAFALNPREWQEYLAAREAKKRKAPTMVESVHATGVSANEARGIEEELADQTGKPLDAKGLSGRTDRASRDRALFQPRIRVEGSTGNLWSQGPAKGGWGQELFHSRHLDRRQPEEQLSLCVRRTPDADGHRWIPFGVAYGLLFGTTNSVSNRVLAPTQLKDPMVRSASRLRWFRVA